MTRLQNLFALLVPFAFTAVVAGCVEAPPGAATAQQALVGDPDDADGDGVADAIDQDDDNDGLADLYEAEADTDGDGVTDDRDLDADADSIPDVLEAGPASADADHDGTVDGAVDELGRPGAATGHGGAGARDTDGDGTPDFRDADSDGDGAFDLDEAGGADLDPDRDGRVADGNDADGDGIADQVDDDREHRGFPAVTAAHLDADLDGVLDPYQLPPPPTGDLDSDGDGIVDAIDVAPTDASRCQDRDGDTCDDCTVIAVGGGDPAVDGDDRDADGLCDRADDDLDNDGVANALDLDPYRADLCGDVDADTCDDCAIGKDGTGPDIDSLPGGDGPDADADGLCDAGDTDVVVPEVVVPELPGDGDVPVLTTGGRGQGSGQGGSGTTEPPRDGEVPPKGSLNTNRPSADQLGGK